MEELSKVTKMLGETMLSMDVRKAKSISWYLNS